LRWFIVHLLNCWVAQESIHLLLNVEGPAEIAGHEQTAAAAAAAAAAQNKLEVVWG
jgi:hypothetical protein